MTPEEPDPTGYCDECGCDAVGPAEVEGFVVRECRMCGALFGPTEALDRIRQLREGRARGVGDAVFPLVEVFESLAGLEVLAAEAGLPEARMPPFVDFQTDLRTLNKITTSLMLCNRRSHARWEIEIRMDRGILGYRLKPLVEDPYADLEPERIAAQQADLALLAASFSRDRYLSWWTSSES